MKIWLCRARLIIGKTQMNLVFRSFSCNFAHKNEKMALIKEVNGLKPKWGKNCYFSENATIVGEVVMGDECSVWFNAVVRGDVCHIHIGTVQMCKTVPCCTPLIRLVRCTLAVMSPLAIMPLCMPVPFTTIVLSAWEALCSTTVRWARAPL